LKRTFGQKKYVFEKLFFDALKGRTNSICWNAWFLLWLPFFNWAYSRLRVFRCCCFKTI